jgi:hypothetical protein
MAMSADIKPSKRVNIQETFVVMAEGERRGGVFEEGAPRGAPGGWNGTEEDERKAVGLAPACPVHKSLLTIA